MSRRSFVLSLVAAVVCSIACSSLSAVWSAPAGFEQAVECYKRQQYSQALSRFEAVSRAHPEDAPTHYYMGLCYQQLNQVASAIRQYKWVAAAGSGSRLRAQAQQGLLQLRPHQDTRKVPTVRLFPAQPAPPVRSNRPPAQLPPGSKTETVPLQNR